MKDIVPDLSQLSPVKRALLQKLLQENLTKNSSQSAPVISKRPRQEQVLASFSQEQLWILDQFEPGNISYNILFAGRLKGVFHAAAFERSLQEIVSRHEALRTTFTDQGGQLVPVIAPFLKLVVPIIDLTCLPEGEQEDKVKRLLQQEGRKPFDLACGPLLRILLVRLNTEEHVALLSMHHIISDGWSMDVLMRELTVLYNAFAVDTPLPLPPLPIQYADFAYWQRQWLQGEMLDAQLAYWTKQLNGIVPLELPTDRPRPAIQTFNGAHQVFLFPRSLLDKLKALSQRKGVTLFMLLLASLQTLLYRYTGQTDIALGTPVANRTQPEIEGLIGYFVNILVMRTNLLGNPSFYELLERVRQVTREAFAHQDMPFTKLVAELHFERNPSYSPLFQVMLAFQDAAMVGMDLKLTDLTLSSLSVESGTARFDITFEIVETDQGLNLLAEYNTDLFEASTITRLMEHWQTLLQGITATPQKRLSELALLSETEQQQLLVSWQGPSVPQPEGYNMIELFEAQVARTPDTVALVWGEQQLSYQALHALAEHLAQQLRQRGIGPELLVGLYLERSLELVVAIIAVLKAGGAYVPLDPAYPAARLHAIMQEAQMALLLTRSHLRTLLPGEPPITLELDDLAACARRWLGQASREIPAPSRPEQHAEQLAYVLYTSGSTGRPKGVALTHRSALTLLHWGRQAFTAEQIRGVLAATSFGFDLSIFEMFVPLSWGGCVILSPSALQLAEQVAAGRLTLLNTVPSVLTELLRRGQLPRSVQVVNLAGEPLARSLVQALYGLDHIEYVYNLYGPTEDTTYSTWAVLFDEPGELVPLGRPLPNTRLSLLDRNGQLVPVGIPGELCLAGSGLARGYLGHPDWTAERFVPNAFSDQPGARLYRTGDLARYRSDGRLEYLGRLDHQVKLRGLRIELGEIEAVLREHPAIEECVVLVRTDLEQDPCLVAYVVGQQGTCGPEPQALRHYLYERLPDYMVPTFFVALQALPMTTNGKVDRQALPAPAVLPSDRDDAPSRTPIEELLGAIWCDMLVRTHVGIHDNFFELGGHSLLAMRLISRIKAVLQVDVALRNLFEAPTIAALAQHIEQVRRAERVAGIPLIVPVAREMALPLSFAQQRLWFLDQLEPGSAAYNIPLAVRLQGLLVVKALEQSMVVIVQRHESLRTTFQYVDGQPKQIIDPQGQFSLQHADLMSIGQRENEAQRLARQEAERPFDLSRRPLLRATLLKLTDEEHLLLLTMHHIVSDGWSMQVLVRDLSTLYRAFATGQPAQLSPLPIQYADFALWQQQWLQGEVLDLQLNYWISELQDVPPLELPTDHPRPAEQSFRGAHQSLLLPAPLHEQFTALSQREGSTLFMTLLAAFQALLYRYSGQVDIAVGTPIANRTRHELEDLIGFFVNTLVLRTDLSGNPSFRELLGRVREVALNAYTHQDIPFEKLVEVLQPERDLSHSPLFQVMFLLQNAPVAVDEFVGITLIPLDQVNATSKFDLTLALHITDQGLLCQVEYSTDLFESATIRRMLGHWHTLLKGILAEPGQRLSHLPLLTQNEQQQLLREWNDTHRDLPFGMSVVQLFEAQAALTPDALAASCEEACLTYWQLNLQANNLAHSLLEQDIGLDTPVAILMGRSLPFLIALLAVFKANAVYLPLDPLYPIIRLRQVLLQSRCRIVLTGQEFLPLLSQVIDTSFADSVPSIVSSEMFQTNEACWLDNLPSYSHPAQLAYVIYTSGSTGLPKGVMVEQQGMLNHMLAKMADVGLSAADSVAQNGPQCFDVSVWQNLAALLVGGQIQIVREEIAFDPARLLACVEERGITLLQVVPSMLRGMLTEISTRGEKQPELRTLRWLIPTGDALPTELCQRWFQRYPHIPVLNTYGATECSDDQCHYPIYHLPAAEEDLPIVSIGFPIANMHTYVLDAALKLVPVGVLGELYLGGRGVGRGYLNDPLRTALAFVPDPFGDQVGGRLYKTGDMVRYLPTGNLEFLGRRDYLVKVRGYRIELGDIEAILAQHPDVQDCLVVVRQAEESREQELVAYVVGRGQSESTAEELRNHLRRKLPDYMVPSWFVQLEALPLNANGKVDRHALPAPSRQAAQQDEALEEKRSPLEEVVATAWREVLGREKLGLHDNFFAQGGHSLLATKLMARLRTVVGIDLPLRSLFVAPTIAGLAKQIERMLRLEDVAFAPPIEPVSRDQDLPLSFAQQRLWFLDQLQPENPAYNIPSGVRLRGRLIVQVLERSLVEIIQRHESLRTAFQTRNDHAVQIIDPVSTFYLPQSDLSGLAVEGREREVRRLTREEAERPFNLSQGPLLRGMLLRLPAEEYVLLLTMHHIISDGWSMDVFVRELTMLYQAFAAAESSPLAPLPIHYVDFAVWQRKWLTGEVLDALINYWKRQLSGAVPLKVPPDRPQSAISSNRGAIHTFTFPIQLYKDLLALSQREGVTLFMALLTAFQTLLYRYTGQQDIVVGTDIANRTHVETEEMIGFFVNLLVLRTQLSGQDTFRDVLRSVCATLLNAYAHQDLPFEKLVDALQLERNADQIPLINVLFVLQNTPLPPLELPGLAISSMPIETDTAKFDLAVFLREDERGLTGFVNYRSPLFDSDSITLLFNHFAVLLQSIVSSSDDPIETLEIYTEMEKEQRLRQETMHRETSRRRLKVAKRNVITLPDEMKYRQ